MNGNRTRLDRFVLLVKLFRLGRLMSVYDAALETGGSPETVRFQIERLHDSGLVHIAQWDRKQFGPDYPLYGWAETVGAADVQLRRAA